VFPSPVPAAAFTVLFTATGLYALVRYAALTSGARAGDRMAELSHLLMSIAMIAMAWGWTGGPGTPGGSVQLVVFGLLAAWYLWCVLHAGGGLRTAGAYHLVVLAAMVWMVAAMPGLMGTSAAAGAASGAHAHHRHGVVAAAATAGVPAPLWMRAVTVAVAVLLCAAAAAWTARAARPVLPALRTGPRLDASCHVLMSLGMAAMLLAML